MSDGRFKPRHGMCRTRIYVTWESMKCRCYNPNYVRFKNYGGRGITVCEEWKNNFEKFYEDMGDPPTLQHTLDRKNNDGGYSKENCKWSTKKEQANNRRKPIRKLDAVANDSDSVSQ